MRRLRRHMHKHRQGINIYGALLILSHRKPKKKYVEAWRVVNNKININSDKGRYAELKK